MNSPKTINFAKYHLALQQVEPIKNNGKVNQVIGLIIESTGPQARMGEICHIYPTNGGDKVVVEVVGFKQNRVLLMPLGDLEGIGPGCEVVSTGKTMAVGVGPQFLGRVLDGLGNPMDGKGHVFAEEEYSVQATPPNPLLRQRITQPLSLGVKAIDGMLTCGKGQRAGIFAGSGVGKSTLLGMIARNTTADINVIALVGERGREVREFIEKDLGEEGLSRSIVVVATSDQPALVRLKAAFVATAMAEYFRDQGKDVMLMMDSVTRFAMAQREIGLAVGEPPATRGYTPSVFSVLPKLMERAGTSDKGTITALYTVLVDGDDLNEPIADAVRGILDGHIVLSRQLASQNHYPSIDVLASISRVMIEVADSEHRRLASELRSILATYRDAKDLVDIGAYSRGSNPKIDHALDMIEQVNQFLCQDIDENVCLEESVSKLGALIGNPV